MEKLFLGIDIGTQGARAVLINELGKVIVSEEEPFELTDDSRLEQSPEMWWECCFFLLKKTISRGRFNGEIAAIAVTSTSGTVIPLDKDEMPLHDAIMYSDPRSSEEGRHCQKIAKRHVEGYTGFNASSGLSKMLWFINNYPLKATKLSRWVHAADYITGKLSGEWGVTDYTNALKSGYDTVKNVWPGYLFEELSLKKNWLPKVVPSGTVIGELRKSLTLSLGLKNQPLVTVGITDGCASQLASGAINPGDWNSTIGTTLVIKGVTRSRMVDPLGRFYSHKHPEGFWMPGGASNTGADWVSQEFGENLDPWERAAERILPTKHLSYPLQQAGERFPFMAPHAKGFTATGITKEEKFVSYMEGVAYLERYAYEVAKELSGENVEQVFSAGGGSFSPSWLKIRSSVMNLPILKMKTITGAFGAGVVASSQTYFNGLSEAGRNLIQLEKEVHPDMELSRHYDQQYMVFVELLKEKNYITL